MINVEYNQLDSLLKSKWNKDGDVANAKGYSHFPGNTNTLLFRLPEYVANLERTKGVIPEFVNPKYADEARNRFKAPTRLECMMQEYPKLISANGAVGFTTYDTWFSFSPVKNNVKDAAALSAKGMPSFGAAQGEYDFFNWSLQVLEKAAGVKVEPGEPADWAGVKLAFGPKVLLDPTFALTISDIKLKVTGANSISKDSTLLVKGSASRIDGLKLDGFLNLVDSAGTGEVSAKGSSVVFVKASETDDEIYRIRGYKPASSQ